MTDDFYCSPDDLGRLRIGVRMSSDEPPEQVRLQVFEVVVAAVSARVRPDYEWWVTPNLPDGGTDFVGRGVFLHSTALGIEAAITVGGQCKKRTKVGNVVDELAGSFVRMSRSLHPTLLVAALSARLTKHRLEQAKAELEGELRRHCHILDRGQIEYLIGRNLSVAEVILQTALPADQVENLLEYFRDRAASTPQLEVDLDVPETALAGEPFVARVHVTRTDLWEDTLQLRWKPPDHQTPITLVAPVAADQPTGVDLPFGTSDEDDPFVAQCDLEFSTFATGSQELGSLEIFVGDDAQGTLTTVPLSGLVVSQNLRPRFYDAPYRAALYKVEDGFAAARAGKVSTVSIVGAGGAGKTRLCEELCLEARRTGAEVVAARQANSIEFPRRILANLLLELATAGPLDDRSADRMDDILQGLEPDLAERARPAVEGLLGHAGAAGSSGDEQALLSVLVLLITRRSRARPLIIHLHDLHWCTLDVLETFERLIWQLTHVAPHELPGFRVSGIRVLFLLEGRTHEFRELQDAGWSTRTFERFLERLECPSAQCRAFEPDESEAFTRRLFEQEHSAERRVSRGLLEIQEDLVREIFRAAGGNPFHILEQAKLLLQNRVIRQHPRTGFLYLIRPAFKDVPLPETVFATIEARWRYCLVHSRELAVLLWAAALVDDRLPLSLFEHLWSEIAPNATQREIEAIEFIRFPRSSWGKSEVGFRHENYFQTLRRVQVRPDERRAVINAYSRWFSLWDVQSPQLLYLRARVELEAPEPDAKDVERHLRSALESTLHNQDRSLSSRILVTLLDELVWPLERNGQLSSERFLEACDQEITLSRLLVSAGRPEVAFERAERALEAIGRHVESLSGTSVLDRLQRRRFLLLAIKGRLLFGYHDPTEAAAVTGRATNEFALLFGDTLSSESPEWQEVAMELYHAHSVAVALAGNLRAAVDEGQKAARIAEELIETTPAALDVIITFGNILLCSNPKESEQILEECISWTDSDPSLKGRRLRVDLHLAMTRILIAHQDRATAPEAATVRLANAEDALRRVFREAHPRGRLIDAAAAALLLGLCHALHGTSEGIDWFLQAATLAARARQIETLWRANINLAHALHEDGQSPQEPASAALEIMISSLESYAEPDRSPRFELISVPLAHAVRYLVLAGDKRVEQVLQELPLLRKAFEDLRSGHLKEDRGGWTSHEWLRIRGLDYVLY